MKKQLWAGFILCILKKTKFLFYFSFFINLVMATPLQGENLVNSDDFRSFDDRINTYFENKNFDALTKTVDKATTQYYCKIVMVLLRLGAKSSHKSTQKEILNHYLEGTLGQHSHIPLKVRASTIDLLKLDAEFANNLDPETWSKYRSVAAKLVFSAWYGLKRSLDKNFAKERKPFLNISPPIETGLPAGVDPKAIKDLDLRKKYELSIADNAEKTKFYNAQYALRKIDRKFSEKAEKYLIDVYTKPPYAHDELEKLADRRILGVDSVEELLSSVGKNSNSDR